MKTSILNIRMSESLKRRIEIMAYEHKVKVSDMVRDILQNKIDEEKNSACYDSMDIFFPKSQDFLWVYSWILQKQYYPHIAPEKKYHNKLKETLVTAIGHRTIPDEVKRELEKVYQDVLRFIDEPEYHNKSFLFSIPNNKLSVNYWVIINFMVNDNKPGIIQM